MEFTPYLTFVIIDPMRVDLFPQSCMTQEFVDFHLVQANFFYLL